MNRLKLATMVFAGALAMCACKQKPAYEIHGTVADPVFEGAKVYLKLGDDPFGRSVSDSTIVTKGKYVFKGSVTQPECGYIMIAHPEDWQKSVHIFLALENVDLSAATDAEDWTVVTGSAFNDAYQEYIEAMREPERQLNEVVRSFYAKKEAGTFAPGEEEVAQEKWDRALQTVRDLEYDYTLRNINNPAFWGKLYNVGSVASLDKQKALLAAADDCGAVIDSGIGALHTLMAVDNRSGVEYLSIVAATIYLLAFAHYKSGENKKAEKELGKAQKLYERLAKKDSDRFTPALMSAVEASTEVFKSKLKKMNVLAHYQVATELYQGKVSAGVTDAINSLVDSITAEGDIHLKMGNYRDAVKFYTKALRYQKRISASMGEKELRISVNLGKALLHLSNRRAAGEQLLNSILPLAEKMGATTEAEEIAKLLSDENKSTFDIAAFWKKLFK